MNLRYFIWTVGIVLVLGISLLLTGLVWLALSVEQYRQSAPAAVPEYKPGITKEKDGLTKRSI